VDNLDANSLVDIKENNELITIFIKIIETAKRNKTLQK